MSNINILLLLIIIVLILYYLNLCKYKKDIEHFKNNNFKNLG